MTPFVLVASLGWALAVTVGRGLVRPNDWAEAHWLLDYRFGSLKRAHIGTLLAPVFDLPFINTEWAIGLFSGLLFTLFGITLLWLCLKILSTAPNHLPTLWVALLFLTSPYIVMIANLIGYFDNIILLLTVAACWLVQTHRPLLSGLILLIGVFVHETIVLVGIPSVLFFALVYHTRHTVVGQPHWQWSNLIRHYWPLVLLPATAFLTLVLYQTAWLDTENFIATFREHLLAHPFIVNNGSELVPTLLATSYFDFLGEQRFLLAKRLFHRGYLLRIMPAVALLLLYVWHRLEGVAHRRLLIVTLAGIALLPLTLHAIAFDTNRIWTYPLIVLLLGIYAISNVYPAGQFPTPWLFSAAATLIVLSQIQMSTPLMGQFAERFTLLQRLLLYAPIFVSAVWLTVQKGNWYGR